MSIKINKFKKLQKEEGDCSLIINEDIYEQESDEEQIIQNEERDEECSFISNKSDKNKIKIKNENDYENNINEVIENINNPENNIIIEESNKSINLENNTNNNVNNENSDISNQIQSKESITNTNTNDLNTNKISKNNSKCKLTKKIIYKKNISNKKALIPNKNSSYNNKKKKSNKNNNNKFKKEKGNFIVKRVQPKMPMTTSHSLIKIEKIKNDKINVSNSEQNKSEKKDKKSKGLIKYLKNERNMKIKLNNSNSKSKNFISSRNENNISFNRSEKNNIITKSDISYDKFGNKSTSKRNEKKYIKIDYNKNYNEKNSNKKNSNRKNIKLAKKINNSYNNSDRMSCHGKSQSIFSYKSNSPKTISKNIKKINLNKIKANQDNIVNKSSIISGINSSMIMGDKKQFEHDADTLKKILINKINNQINEIIQGNEKVYFNENHKLFFLGFCDILFEIGFVHIKETEINDISEIKKHIDDLCTQPFTNRALLSESFLFNEQQLLICAWKTILNNFILVKEFQKLPQENEEISLDDCKLFIFIVTGLFIGYNNKFMFEKKINSDRKIITKNNSISNFNLSPNLKKSKDFTRNILSKEKLNQSYTKSNHTSAKKNKYQFRKKNGINKSNNSHNNSSFNENVLKNILDNRKKSNYNYKSLLKIKNFFNYFAELRKLYNLYKKDLKKIVKKKDVEKDLTFFPKTNKNNKILLGKFAPSMNFFERNDIIKNRNNQKKIILQRERSQKMLKECTFEACKNSNSKENKSHHKDPKEISNRLYYNYSRKKQNKENNTNANNISMASSNRQKTQEELNNSEYNINKKRIYSKALIRSNKINSNNDSYYINKNKKNSLKENMINLKTNINANINLNINNTSCSKIHIPNTNYIEKPKEIFRFSPNLNKKFNRAMFANSPLRNDELLNKRIQKLRDTNFKKFLNNYEKNNREILSDSVKRNKNILKELISCENKGMRMDIEKRTNKDTFENFQNYDMIYSDNYILNNQFIEPLFTVEIKIKEKVKTIEVYPDDVPEKLAYDFCVKNQLGKGSFEKIVTIIKGKLEEISNGNFNEDINFYSMGENHNYLNNEYQNQNQNDNELKENNDEKENFEEYKNYEHENNIDINNNINNISGNNNIFHENNIKENLINEEEDIKEQYISANNIKDDYINKFDNENQNYIYDKLNKNNINNNIIEDISKGMNDNSNDGKENNENENINKNTNDNIQNNKINDNNDINDNHSQNDKNNIINSNIVEKEEHFDKINDENIVNDDYDIDKINNNIEEINSNELNDNITNNNNNLNNIINQ